MLNFKAAAAAMIFLFSTVAPVTRAHGAEPAKTPVSVTAKLYAAAKMMDHHEKWPAISELLREILDMKLDNDYVVSRIKQVKKYVDRESTRQAISSLTGSRLDTHSFLEARLLVVECIQELRPRLNLSWTGEVRHLKRTLFTALFPHFEQSGKIEFPAPNTYSFDLYAYTLKNLKALMIAKGGKELEPLFKEFLVDKSKKSPTKPGEDDDDVGSNMYWRRLSNFRDRIYSSLMTEGVDPSIIPSDGWDPTDDNGPDWKRGNGRDWSDDDWDWRRRGDLEDKILSLKKAYQFVTNIMTTLRNHRSIDDYEPLTLLMIAVANPALIEEDPQLKDFVAGIKFKFEVPLDGVDTENFKPKDYELVKLVNDALIPSTNTKVSLEVNSTTGQKVLYVISNVNGHSNLVSNILSFKNVVTFVQTAKHMPEGVVTFVKATPENIAKLTEALNKMIQGMSTNSNMIYRLVGYPTQVAFDIVVTLGGKTLSKVAGVTTKVLQKVITNPKVAKTIEVVKSEKFLRTMIALSVAADVTQGVVELIENPDPNQRPQIVMHTAANVGGAMVYLVKYDRAIWAFAALDIGHLMFESIPSVSQIFEFGLHAGYGFLYKKVNGYSPREHELRELKGQLQMKDEDEAVNMLTEYEASIKGSKELKDLQVAKSRLSEKLGVYAAKRLVFHYVAITALNGHGDHDVGVELRNQDDEYDRIFWTWYNAPGSSVKEQAGLALLDRDFDKKWVEFGGKLPEKPKPAPKKEKPAPEKPKTSKKDPWEDGEQE